MEAPDKIYIEIRHPFGNEFTEMIGFENYGNSEDIAYIRKDTLLKWANDNLLECEVSDDDTDYGRIDAYKKLIDKINSL